MTDPLARPVSPVSHQIPNSSRPEPASAMEPAPELTSLGLARAFFGPEVRLWRGEQPLCTVFWIYGVLATMGLGALYAFSLYHGRIGLQQLLLFCIAGYVFWVLVSLWRSSQSAIVPLWGVLARQLTVVWAVGAVLVLIFLQLDLVEKYLEAGSPAMASGSPLNAGVHGDRNDREVP